MFVKMSLQLKNLPAAVIGISVVLTHKHLSKVDKKIVRQANESSRP